MKKQLLLIIMSLLEIPLASSQPTVSVWGTDDSVALRQQIVRYLEYLEVQENIYVLVSFTRRMPKQLDGLTYPLFTDTSRIIKVQVQVRLPKRQRRIVLAHEMIHVKQYAKGEIQMIDHRRVRWKGRTYYYGQDSRYLPPWEREARLNDRKIAEACEEQKGLRASTR